LRVPPAACSPSLNVVSKMITLSIFMFLPGELILDKNAGPPL
jgi:hypothetical protein